LLALPLLAGCSLGQVLGSPDQTNGGEQIPVADQLDVFYQQNGGTRNFGYTLTEAFPDGDMLVQYFQRMRLEYDLSRNDIFIAPLGEWAVPALDNQILAPVAPSVHSRLFEETGFTVQDEFLTYYETNNGEVLFGPPISPQLDEGGARVQYFQNARLEWHPDAPLEYRVQVGRLGESHYRDQGIYEDPVHGQAIPSAGLDEAVLFANVMSPIQYEGDEQVIYVDVATQDGRRRVQAVSVEATAYYESGSKTIELPDTDGLGHTQGALKLDDATPGQDIKVIIEAFGATNELIGSTSLTYTKWW